MTIETKHSIGDFVWIMHDNKTTRVEITGIHTDTTSASYPKSHASYLLHGIAGMKEEWHMFPTKEALLQSL